MVAAGERGTDLAVRLTYAGVEHTPATTWCARSSPVRPDTSR